MELTEFCMQADQILAARPAVVLVTSEQFNPLSFEKIVKFIHQKSDIALQKLDLDQDFSQLVAKLQTSFLGQHFLFWFGDLSLISSKKKRSDLVNFIKTYQGPHQIIGWLHSDEIVQIASDVTVVIEIRKTYSKEMVYKISFLYQTVKPEIAAYFLGRLYRIHKEYSLEQLCLLENYVGLMGKNIDLFFENWLQNLVINDVSLFYLAQLFFEKRADEFFECWHQMRGYYPDQFWIVFFSDHLFKAYFYTVAQGRIAAEQKQLTYGLPFSFLKQDWRFFKPAILQQAHANLYEVDGALKNGGNSYMLDAFFMKFFAQV